MRFSSPTFSTLLLALCLFAFQVVDVQAQNTSPADTPLSASNEEANNTQLAEAPPTEQVQEKTEKKAEKAQQEIIDTAIEEFNVTDENGEKIVCSKEDTVAVDIDGKVNYRCRTAEKALGESDDVQQGEGETNQFIDSLLIESKQADDKEIKLSSEQIKAITQAAKEQEEKDLLALPPTKESAVEKAAQQASEEKTNAESGVIFEQKEDGELQLKTQDKTDEESEEKVAAEDKASEADEAAKIILVAEEKKEPISASIKWIQRIPVKAYFSLRATYKSLEKDNRLQDDNSRLGLIYAKKLESDDSLILHVEAGTNAIDHVISYTDNEDSESLSFKSRLAYFRYGRDDYYVVIGKNWSVYHYIASMTDKFNSVGGVATGIYNAHSDGGSTGTGRASKALQLRSSRGIFQWGTQLQTNTDIPLVDSDSEYSLNAALMAKIKFLNGFGVGASILKAVPSDITQDMAAIGFVGETTAAVIGAEWKIADWNFSVTTASNKNLVTDDQLHYYDAWGTEFYTTTNFTPLTQFRLGFSYQTPSDTDEYLGEHEIMQAYIGWQYNYNKNDFSDRVFIEYAFNEGTNADGSSADNVLNIGIRYNLQN